MGLAVVTVASGGLPVVDVTGIAPRTGTPVTEATNGRGIAVTKVIGKPGLPVVFETIGVAAPFATFNGTPSTAFITLSNGNLTVTKNSTPNVGEVISLSVRSSGKYYFEIINTLKSGGTSHTLGVKRSAAPDLSTGFVVVPGGATIIYNNGTDTGKDLGVGASGNRYDFAIDLTNRLGWIRRAGGNWNADPTANPATGVGGLTIVAGSFAPGVYLSNGGGAESVTANFGASAFVGAVPAGFTSGWPA